MTLVIPKSLQTQIRRRAQRRGLTETEYVRTALKQTIEAEDELAAEMRPWDKTSLQDFDRFAKKHKL